MKKVFEAVKVVFVVLAIAILHCVIWVCDKCADLRDWFVKPFNPTMLRLALVYLLGFIGLSVGWWVGFLGPVLVSAGWVAKAVGVLVLAHMVLSFYTAYVSKQDRMFMVFDTQNLDSSEMEKVCKMRFTTRKHEGLVNWLEKVDASILGIGFLGKLISIAVVLKSIVTSSDAAAITAGLATISAAVSVALYSTAMGLALSLWTHCATLVISNKLATLRE